MHAIFVVRQWPPKVGRLDRKHAGQKGGEMDDSCYQHPFACPAATSINFDYRECQDGGERVRSDVWRASRFQGLIYDRGLKRV